MSDHSEPVRADADPPKASAGGVVATWVRFVVITLVGVGQAPILFRWVPATELGVWYLLFAFATFISLSDLGLGHAFARAVSYRFGPARASPGAPGPEGSALYRDVTLPQLYVSVLSATAVFGIALAALSIPGAFFYFSRTVPPAEHAAIFGPVLVFLAGVVLNLVATVPGACLSGSGEVTLDSVIRTAVTLLGFALTVLLVPAHPSLGVLCAIFALQGAVGFAVAHVVVARRRVGSLRGVRPSLPLVRGLLHETGPLFVTRIGLWLTQESTLLVGASFMGPQRIADFGLLRQIVGIGAAVVGAIPLAVSPKVAAAHAAGDRESVRDLYLAALRYAWIVNALWAVGAFLWAGTLIELLVGAPHYLGAVVLAPLVLAMFLELHAVTHAYFVWNVGTWPFARPTVTGGVLNVVLASTGASTFGFAGLAWGSLAAQAATLSWIQVTYALRILGVSVREYARDIVAPAALYAGALGALATALHWTFRRWAPSAANGGAPERAAWALAAIAATALLAAALAWRLTLTPADRLYFRRLLRLRR
ncbi:MAG TPA: hypothetical protein VF875_11165 [Anaeromyxobacter sp.]